MTRDDIIRIAHRYGLCSEDGRDTDSIIITRHLEHFVSEIISQHVRESRPDINADEKKWLQQIAYQHGGIGDLASHEFEFGAMVAAAEREACAEVAEKYFTYYGYQYIADDIRARGQA